jgi:hypothetical protein
MKDILINKLHDYEGLMAFSSCFLMMQTIDWTNEIIKYIVSFTMSILSAYVVNRLKKRWDKKENNTEL